MSCGLVWESEEGARHRGMGAAWCVLCVFRWLREGLCPSISPSETHFCNNARNRCLGSC